MNKLGKERLLGIFFALVIISILIIAGPAEALSFSITDIPDTNKGDTLDYDINVDVLDTEMLPLQNSVLTIKKMGSFFDVFTCTIFEDGTFSCTRQKGSSSAPINPDSSITITRTNEGGVFGYGNFSGGRLRFHVQWDTPVDLKPGLYGTQLVIRSGDSQFESEQKLFNIITPARPRDRFSIRASGRNSMVGSANWNSQNNINLFYSNVPPEQGQSNIEIQRGRDRLGISLVEPRLLANTEDEILVKYKGSGLLNRVPVQFSNVVFVVDKHTGLVDVTGTGTVNFQINDLHIYFQQP